MLHLLISLALLATLSNAAPATNERNPKSLSYYDYLPPVVDEDYANYEEDNNVPYMAFDASRTLPSRKSTNRNNYNSPIYYIRLPPQPYMFVPGLGYMSQPPPHPMSQLVNLPVSFINNGKPSAIYQWTAGLDGFGEAAAPVKPVMPTQPPPPKKPDSQVHQLQGQFTFNGKPEDIFVLRDSYNSLYSDALQNFYP